MPRRRFAPALFTTLPIHYPAERNRRIHARRLPEIGGVFVQAESEVAVSNMLIGAVSTGKRAFTSSSGPGISLMQEAISTIAGLRLPVVLINIHARRSRIGAFFRLSPILSVNQRRRHGD